jgi:hypothetical protein
MKKVKAVILLLILCNNTKAQISLDHTFIMPNGAPQAVLFSVNSEKIVTYDAANVYLYDMSYSLWRTINTAPPAGYSLYAVYAVSDNLFNSDALVELIVIHSSSTSYPRYRASVINETGVVLQNLDSTYYAAVHFNSVSGTYKIFATSMRNLSGVYNSATNIYSVPGTLPCGLPCGTLGSEKPVSGGSNLFVSEGQPNPSNGEIRINYQIGNGDNFADLIVNDMSGKLIKTFTVDKHSNAIEITKGDIPPGMYLFYLKTNSEVSGTRKMIIIQ